MEVMIEPVWYILIIGVEPPQIGVVVCQLKTRPHPTTITHEGE
jgi:hypothetical protein